MTTFTQFAAPSGRVLLALMFIMSGFSKIGGYAATQGYMEAFGVPGALLPLVIIVEVVGGIAIALGWYTKLAAFALAGFTLVAAVLFHNNFADQMQMILFMKNLSVAGGLLFLVSAGAGSYSIDNRKAA